MNFKTYLRIPFKRAPEDPEWMLKVKSGRKLNPIEVEQYYKHQFDIGHAKLLKDQAFYGIPSYAAITKTIREYHYFKKDCLTSFLYCGIAYNPAAFTGADGECGKTDHFAIWKKNVNEKLAQKFIGEFMEHYEFPMFYTPQGMDKELNTFYQAKYGMFTCHDLNHCIGQARYDADLVNYWNRKLRDKKETWYLAIAYSISNGKIKLQHLQDYKKNYRESTAYQKYLRKNKSHLQDLEDQINQIQSNDYYEAKAIKRAEKRRTEACEKLFKTIKHYQTKTDQPNYVIPDDLKSLIDIKDDQQLRQKILDKHNNTYNLEIKRIKQNAEFNKGKTVPEFLTDPEYFRIKGGRESGRSMQHSFDSI